MRPMLPTCFANPATNAFSVSVFVSAGELANIVSIFFAISGERSGSATLITYHPTWPASPELRTASYM